MELFSEIYGAYYNAVSKILSLKNLSAKDILKIIKENAFSESSLYIMPRIKDEWHLVSENNGVFNSNLKNIPSMPLTLIQKKWIKTIISDPKAKLFIDDNDISRISDYLKDVKPLFDYKNFFFFDRFSDGDDFSNPEYIKFFRTIHKAITDNEILRINFISSKGNNITHDFLPVKFEYSPKNNKFRTHAFIISNQGIKDTAIINISRISSIKNTGKYFEVKNKNIHSYIRCPEPVCVEISHERNGVERFMMEFAGYEKVTEFNEQTGICSASIWYNKTDETELLIRLLSFGTVLEIKSPEYFRSLARERIEKQCSFFQNSY